MRENYPYFTKEIYNYCDENVGEKVLFPIFLNLWPEDEFIFKRDLIGLTEKIINNLIKDNILIEVEKPEKLDGPYGYYEILPHRDLIKNNDYIRKKMKLLD